MTSRDGRNPLVFVEVKRAGPTGVVPRLKVRGWKQRLIACPGARYLKWVAFPAAPCRLTLCLDGPVQQYHRKRPASRRCLVVPEVPELQFDAEVLGPQDLDGVLKLVLRW